MNYFSSILVLHVLVFTCSYINIYVTCIYCIGNASICSRGRCGRDRMVLDLQLPMQSVPITTDIVSSNLDQGEVYNIM